MASFFVQHFGISCEQATSDVSRILENLADDRSLDEESDEDRTRDCGEDRLVASTTISNRNKPAECGVFRFGRSRLRVRSAVPELDKSFFLRFQHRAVDGCGADVLEVSGADSAYLLSFRGSVTLEAKTINRAMWQLVELFLSLEHSDKPMLAYCHAGAVSRWGRSVLMPGSSGVGKTTLTGFLVAHGFAYLGDDIICIGESDMAVLPLPTCLSIKAGSWSFLQPYYHELTNAATLNRYGRSVRYVAPDGNYETQQAAASPSAIVFPAYCAGQPTRLTPLAPLQTMTRLLEANVRLSGWGAATEDQLVKFVRFVEQTPAYELSYSELPEAMKAIEELLGSQP